THVVDLVAEYPAPRWVRALPGYRNLPILDGAEPPSREAFLDVVRDLRDVTGDVLVHCDSGRGRAPTWAAALLIARGLAPDVDSALALVRAGRQVSSPTGVDVAFLQSVLPSLRALQTAPASDEIGRWNSGRTSWRVSRSMRDARTPGGAHDSRRAPGECGDASPRPTARARRV